MPIIIIFKPNPPPQLNIYQLLWEKFCMGGDIVHCPVTVESVGETHMCKSSLYCICFHRETNPLHVCLEFLKMA